MDFATLRTKTTMNAIPARTVAGLLIRALESVLIISKHRTCDYLPDPVDPAKNHSAEGTKPFSGAIMRIGVVTATVSY